MSACRIIKAWSWKCVTSGYTVAWYKNDWLRGSVLGSRSLCESPHRQGIPLVLASSEAANSCFEPTRIHFTPSWPILFNIIFAYASSRSSKWHTSFRFPDHNLVLNFFFRPNAYYVLPVCHSAWFDYSVFWRVQVVKVLMRGREKMRTFMTLRHSKGSASLLFGVPCPFCLSLVDSVCVRRDSADTLNE